MGGLITGLFGGLGGNSAAQEAQQRELAAARQNIQAYRPEAMQARLNAFQTGASAYQGANNALETLYGGRPELKTPRQQLSGAGFQPRRGMGHELPQGAAPPLPPPPSGPSDPLSDWAAHMGDMWSWL